MKGRLFNLLTRKDTALKFQTYYDLVSPALSKNKEGLVDPLLFAGKKISHTQYLQAIEEAMVAAPSLRNIMSFTIATDNNDNVISVITYVNGESVHTTYYTGTEWLVELTNEKEFRENVAINTKMVQLFE